MRIPDSVIAEVAAAADIVRVISEYVDLKKAGKDYRGLCPFHGEKTPSFYVSPQKGIFHCFGCAVGGSVFNFIMRIESVSFVEAVRLLAQRYAIALPIETGRPGSNDERARLLRLLESASGYFRACLGAEDSAASYLADRGIPTEWIERIGFGFAPESWDGFQKWLGRGNLDVRDAVAVGLVKPRAGGGYYDYFRSRVMIPIRDLNGSIVAFGGRIHGEGEPKYLNSPESAVYRKRNLLFGLDAAKEAIRREGFLIVVEGYFDQISLRIRGVENTVAPLGTALGTDQIRLIKRFTDEVVTIFDGDDAGLRAARRVIPLFLAEGLDPRCVVLRDHKDPDEAINQIGEAAFRRMVDSAGSMIDFLLEGLQARHDLDTIRGRNMALEECLAVIREIADSKEQDYLIERVSARLKVREDRVRQMLKGKSGIAVRPQSNRSPARRGLFDFPAEERNVVRGMLLRPGFVERVVESGIVKDLEDPVLKTLAEKMIEFNREAERFDAVLFCSGLDDQSLASVAASWMKPRPEEDDLRPEVDGDEAIQNSIDVIRRKKIERRKAEIKERMRQCAPAGDEYNRLAEELGTIAWQLHR